MGGLRAGGNRPGFGAGQPDRRVHRRHVPRLCRRAAAGTRGGRGLSETGYPRRGHVRPDLLFHGIPRSYTHRGHGVFVVAGGIAPGVPCAAAERMLAGTRRRRHGDVFPRHLHRLQPAGRARPGRQVQALCRAGRRLRCRRGGGDAAAGAVVGRASSRASGAGGGAGVGGELRRRQQRTDGAERAGAAAADPAGVGGCRGGGR